MNIRNIGREICLCEITLAAAESGEIESEHRDAQLRQHAADAKHGDGIFGAGKTMAGNGKGSDLSRW